MEQVQPINVELQEWFTSLFVVWLIIFRHLIRLPYIDGNKVGVYGKVTMPLFTRQITTYTHMLYVFEATVWCLFQAYGGFLSSLLLLSHSSVFQCGIAVAPITNWRLYGEITEFIQWWNITHALQYYRGELKPRFRIRFKVKTVWSLR